MGSAVRALLPVFFLLGKKDVVRGQQVGVLWVFDGGGEELQDCGCSLANTVKSKLLLQIGQIECHCDEVELKG